ncbi:MAG: phosphodiester glycosidase family protein [Chloroflexi bacterium]|nr:phosphodiester glycosidase family protein [Chloroflexota bacterium]
MKTYRLTVVVLLILILLAGSAQPVLSQQSSGGWQTLAPGIEYQKFSIRTSSGPNQVFVSRMDRRLPYVTVESSLATGRLTGRETTSGQARRYDGTVSQWGDRPGGRSRVLVAVNGYYFDTQTGVPRRGQVQSGWFVKRFDECHSGSGFAWTRDGRAFIGGGVQQPAANQLFIHYPSGKDQKIHLLNTVPGSQQLSLFTPQYSSHTPPYGGSYKPGLEIVVEMTEPAGLVPYNQKNPRASSYTGYIREIITNPGSTPIQYDQVVLAAHEDFMAGKLMSWGLQVGDQVGIAQAITHCGFSDIQEDWSGTYTSIGGDFHFLRDVRIQSMSNPAANVLDSRTAVAYNQNYIFFMVVDGQNPGVSVGMTTTQLGEFALQYLGATDAVSLDSGGSSTMVVNGQVVNNTYCNEYGSLEKGCKQSQLVASLLKEDVEANLSQLPPELSETYQLEWEASAGAYERYVANGLMMVYVEPAVTSGLFRPWDDATTRSSSELYLGPGDNFAPFNNVPAGANVTIMPTENGVNGVAARGGIWWKVNYGGIAGWIRQSSLNGGILNFLPFIRR